MKKKLLAISLCVCTAFSMVGCGNSEKEEETTTSATESTASEEAAEATEGEITLGEYKGLKVDASLSEVSDENLQAYIKSVLESFATTEDVKEGTYAEGDVAKLSYTCTIDGEEYKTAEGAEIELVENGFDVEGFTDAIIGKKVGDKYDITFKLADNFADTEVAGKDANFTITLEAIVNTIIPELTDEFVATNFDYLQLTNVEEFKAYLTHDLLINQVYNEIWQEVVDNATVVTYDSEDLKTMTEEYAYYQEYYISYYTGQDLATYLTENEITEEEFMATMEETAKTYLKSEMLVYAIAEAEGLELTEELYQKEMLEFAKSYGYDTVAEFEEAYAETMTTEDFEYSVLSYLVEELVCESVEFVEGYGLRATEDDKEQETSSAAATE